MTAEILHALRAPWQSWAARTFWAAVLVTVAVAWWRQDVHPPEPPGAVPYSQLEQLRTEHDCVAISRWLDDGDAVFPTGVLIVNWGGPKVAYVPNTLDEHRYTGGAPELNRGPWYEDSYCAR